MIQVNLKINYVKLHIAEPLLIQLAVKNEQNASITIPSLFPLFQGHCEINTVFQFMTSSKKVQLCVLLFKNYQRKFAGMVGIDVKRNKFNQKVEICQFLKNSVDKNAQISFQIAFSKSKDHFQSIDLISLHDREMMNLVKQQSVKEFYLKQLKEKNAKVEEQYRLLSEQNRQLYQNLEILETEHDKLQNSWESQISAQEQELTETVNKLQKQKILTASIIDIVLENGDPRLMEIIENILQIKQHSQL